MTIATSTEPRDPWVTPCRYCGKAGMNFDLRRDSRAKFGLRRYCRDCDHARCAFAGCRNTRSRSGLLCYGHDRQSRLGKELQPLGTYTRGVSTCSACGCATYPGKRQRGMCNTCWMADYRARKRKGA